VIFPFSAFFLKDHLSISFSFSSRLSAIHGGWLSYYSPNDRMTSFNAHSNEENDTVSIALENFARRNHMNEVRERKESKRQLLNVDLGLAIGGDLKKIKENSPPPGAGPSPGQGKPPPPPPPPPPSPKDENPPPTQATTLYLDTTTSSNKIAPSSVRACSYQILCI